MRYLFRRHGRRSSFFVNSLCGAIVAIALFDATNTRASSSGKVYFAGVVFTNAAASVQQTFPHASAALSADGNTRLNQSIRQQLQTQAAGLDVVFDDLGSIKDASKSTALALGIDRESTSVEHIGNVYKLRVEIAAEALFFDFKENRSLVASRLPSTSSTRPLRRRPTTRFKKRTTALYSVHQVAIR